MKLHFDAKIVKLIREHAASAPDHIPLYDQPETKRPGLWLVGDQGVYLMSNGTPHQPRPGGLENERLVAYAAECNPETLPFEQWWEAKGRSFGADDGSEFIALEDVPENGEIVIDISRNGIEILHVHRQPDPKDIFAAIKQHKDGPDKKFRLIKFFGPALRKAGHEPKTMSCKDIEAAVAKLLNGMH